MIQNKIIFKIYPKLFYHCTILTVFFIIFIISSSGNTWGANIYIDPTYNGTELGTFEKPYNSWNDISSFSSINDYRQKCGTAYYGTLKITESGTSYDHIIIGAYSDNGDKPVHEDDDPSFGRLCGNSAQKPIIKQTLGSGALIVTATSGNQYLEINSIQLKDADAAMYIKSNYNRVRYCYLYNLYWGIGIGVGGDGDHNTIEFNYIDLNDTVNADGKGYDAITLQGSTAYNTIQYNHISGYDHAGIGVFGQHHTIQYNYLYAGTNRTENESISHNYNGDDNVIRFNYFKDTGLYQIMGGDRNSIYGNIMTCNGLTRPVTNQGCFSLESFNKVAYSVKNNKIYNNIIYDADRNTTQHGIKVYSGGDDRSDISGNEFYNNIVHTVSGYCIKVVDNNDLVGTNYFKSNSCYGYGSNQFANIEGSKYTTASAFNVRGDASGNRDDDPGLSNPSAGQFWPKSISANVVGNGQNLGSDYNRILDQTNTDFEASPPKVRTEVQPVDWYIGAYALVISKKMNPPPAKMSGFRVISKK